MSLYVISIGGTGARCVEGLIHLAASGLLGQERIQFLFIDPDESNGNLQRTRETLKLYQDCRGLMVQGSAQTPWLQTPLEALEVWSPFQGGGNKKLGVFFDYERYQFQNQGLGHLFDVLYTKQERESDLDVGFRGRPAIGSAVMSQMDESQEPWRSLLQSIKMDLGQGKFPKLFLCGSIFGGTGASGFPTIGRLLHKYFTQQGDRQRIKLGGLLMLPYFQFTPDQDPGAIYARPEQFLLNTEAALRYYKIQSDFDTVYLLGDQELTKVGNFSIGKNTQKNDPHFVEFYAALATRNFFLSPPAEKVVLLSRREAQRITWDDVPDRGVVKTCLANTVRFAFLWVANLEPELQQGKTNIGEFQKLAPWFKQFFRPKGLFVGGKNLPDLNEEAQQEIIRRVHDWSVSFLRWIGMMHHASGESRQLQLFRAELFLERNGEVRRKTDDLPRLVMEAQGLEQLNTASPQAIKEQLATYPVEAMGAVGLATALYDLSKP